MRWTVAFVVALFASWFVVADVDDCDGADLSQVVKVHAGVNGIWTDGPNIAFPSDVELGGRASASLSPHISVGSDLYYGTRNTYVRWGVGPRITVTDVDDPNFSVGLGAQYCGGSEPSVLPEEWVAEASFGWRVAPNSFKRLIVVGQGGYGFTTSKARAIVGVRWSIPL